MKKKMMGMGNARGMVKMGMGMMGKVKADKPAEDVKKK